MALTPEDVVNKRFQPTKFREGYDQDEVDDFLDEVVVELRRLNQENEELRQRLMQADSRINQLQSAPQQQAPQAPAPQMAPPPQAAPAFAAAAAPAPGLDSMDPGNTNNLLQLARTLHEQHVREGIEKRDALIAEGQAAAARVIQEAEAQQRSANNGLEQERQELELRNFERDYRAKLKGYIEGQLRDLDMASVASVPQAAPHAATAPQQPLPPQQPAPVAYETAAPVYEAPAPAAAPVYEAPSAPYGAPAYGAPPQQAPQGYPGFAGQ
jgi:DivIVA domain-containing protein